MTVPQELLGLVSNSIPAGAKIVDNKFDSSHLCYQFTIKWHELSHAISIRTTQWEDQQFEFIRLLSRLSVPSPESTREGRGFWVSYDDELVGVQGDYTLWAYFVRFKRRDEPIPFTIKITGTAHSFLDREADHFGHEDRAFRISAGLWHLKHCLDKGQELRGEVGETIDSNEVPRLVRASQVNDQEIRHYVERKVYQGYLGSDGNIQQEFDWIDFQYLGINEQDFKRAIQLREGRDWETDHLQVRPTSSLLERLDARAGKSSRIRKSTVLKKAENEKPRMYGKWKILDLLKEGGQAHTFYVQDSTNPVEDKKYVLKRLKNPARIGRFRQEIEIGLTLEHPNLVKVFDFDLEAQKPYLVTEYYQGGDLQTKLEGKGINPVAALKMFLFVCRGIAYAHEKKVTHRDLKPSNIFLRSHEGEPVVGDFGICHVEHGERFTIMKEAVGPRYYMAPELEEGRVEQVSTRSDIYSLGKVLYWMVTGTIFSREKHRFPEYDLVKKLNNPRLEHVNKILDKAITNDPELRFPSAIELTRSVEEAMSMLEAGFNPIDPNIEQRCIYCGKGIYSKFIDPQLQNPMEQGDKARNYFNLSSMDSPKWMMLICKNCGNTQIFRPDLSDNPEIWGQG